MVELVGGILLLEDFPGPIAGCDCSVSVGVNTPVIWNGSTRRATGGGFSIIADVTV